MAAEAERREPCTLSTVAWSLLEPEGLAVDGGSGREAIGAPILTANLSLHLRTCPGESALASVVPLFT